MFVKNPQQKESYSFRVKPDLLEKIKHYAKATNQTVPKILNNMIEEKVDGLYLTNDYLEETIDSVSIIGLPPLEDMYNNGKYKEFGLFFENKNRVLYEIQKVPNNLDIWTDKEGYTSNKRGVDHEGLSFVLAPELITKPEYLETPELLLCCLVPIYFKISISKRSIQVKNISFNEALDKIRQTPNMELLDEFTKNTQLVTYLINSYYNKYKTATKNPDGTYTAGGFTYSDKNQLLLDIYSKLIIELNEATININVNVINHIDKANERQNEKLERGTSFVYYSKTEFEKLQEENEALQSKVNELENKFNNLNKLILSNISKEDLDNIEKYL